MSKIVKCFANCGLLWTGAAEETIPRHMLDFGVVCPGSGEPGVALKVYVIRDPEAAPDAPLRFMFAPNLDAVGQRCGLGVAMDLPGMDPVTVYAITNGGLTIQEAVALPDLESGDEEGK